MAARAWSGNEASVQSMVDRMVEIAAEVAEGDLSTLHLRTTPDGLERKLSEALQAMLAELLGRLSGPEAYIQGRPNVRIHRPFDEASVIPFHSDVLYGHSPDEINYWVCLTPAYETNSLWMASATETECLHNALKYHRLTLQSFETLARRTARPIHAPIPSVHTFCCAQLHGSVLNETDRTRVSVDVRTLAPGCRAGVKRMGGYFRPQWLPGLGCPLPPGTPVATVATLDEQTPVYLQRVAMERFYPQGRHRELVEFHGLPFHAPTLTDAMARGPVLAYTVRQLKAIPRLSHPVGFADERLWITPDRIDLLDRFLRELNAELQGK